MSGMPSALPVSYDSVDSFDGFVESRRFYSDSALERRKMIGAAGELYVSYSCLLPKQWRSLYPEAHNDSC